MGIPKKALKKSQLEFLTAGSAVSNGSHQIYRVNFIEQGVKKTAFYKSIDSAHHYPELLALISVATSAFKRSFQGEYSAEERLVFDDDERPVGTLSIAIEEFSSLNCKGEAEPLEPNAKELAVPSTKTLIESNMMQVLLGRYFLDDDDSHPQNIGFAGSHAADIDFDMFWYWFTIWMKEPRAIIGVPKKHVSLTVRDWEAFPRTCDAKHYHWPTYERPGEQTLLNAVPEPVQATIVSPVLTRTLPKAYPDPQAFQQLANSPEAQEQKLFAALKILLVYQPAMMRARLTELFGSLPLNYTSLGQVLSAKYETEFPSLCNAKTNVLPFADFMMSLYQKHYDSLYRVVVFYMGCPNNGFGVPLPPTYQALYEKPSLFKKIKEWVVEQNKTLYSKEQSAVQYNCDELKNRYHQIWRDAFAPRLKTLLHCLSTLITAVTNLSKKTDKLTLDQSFINFSVLLREQDSKTKVDVPFTRASELFGTLLNVLPKEQIMREIAVEPDSDLGRGLQGLIDFTNELSAYTKIYYDKSCAELTDEDSTVFVSNIEALCTKYKRSIRQSLSYTSSYSTTFADVEDDLALFAKQADFPIHLITRDKPMHAAAIELPLTHEETKAQFNEALFLWAKTINRDELTRLINKVIDEYYRPASANPLFSLFSTRNRSESVKAYLATSANESGDSRLAYILSTGNSEIGALKTLLIQYLTPEVLKSNDLRSIKNAIKTEMFLPHLNDFTQSAVLYAKTVNGITHRCHDATIKLFYTALFAWMEHCNKSVFNKLIHSALEAYEASLSKNRYALGYSLGIFSPGRTDEIKEYCAKNGQAKAIALTFLAKGKESTLNQILFRTIVAAIQQDKTKPNTGGYALFDLYEPGQHEALYLKKMAEESASASHTYSSKSVAAVVS